MEQYILDKALKSTFDDNPWWVFMGKYFGFPDCCIKNFCSGNNKESSLFDGTGYVPCSCCNKTITCPKVVQEFTDRINEKRYHNYLFNINDNFEDNPHFFKIMEDFYIANKEFPYKEMVTRGGQQYLYEKFLNKDFSFLIYLQDKKNNEELSMDLSKVLDSESFYWIFNDLIDGPLTSHKKNSLLEDLNLYSTHTIVHKKTKQSVNNYMKDFEFLMTTCFDAFTYQNKYNNKKNTDNTSKKAHI